MVITGMRGHLAGEITPRLLGLGHEVIGLSTGPATDIAGVSVIGDWLRAPAAADVLAAADTVVNFAGAFARATWSEYEQANVECARRIRSCASPTTRMVHLSAARPEADSPNWYARSKALGEQILTEGFDNAVVLRPDLVLNPPEASGGYEHSLVHRGDRPVVVLGPGTRLIRPVMREDVLDSITLAVEGGIPAGVYALSGPDEMTVDELVELVNGRPVPVAHLLVRHASRAPELPVSLLEYLESQDGLRPPEAIALQAAVGRDFSSPRLRWKSSMGSIR